MHSILLGTVRDKVEGTIHMGLMTVNYFATDLKEQEYGFACP